MCVHVSECVCVFSSVIVIFILNQPLKTRSLGVWEKYRVSPRRVSYLLCVIGVDRWDCCYVPFCACDVNRTLLSPFIRSVVEVRLVSACLT